jgi:uncharacterized integral membrane protein
VVGRAFYWLIVIPLFLVVIIFAVTNHGMTQLSLWPVLTEPVLFPVYGIALVGLFIGFVIGGLVSWIQNGRSRRRARELRRQSEADQREIAVLRDRLANLEARERHATTTPTLVTSAAPAELAVRE